jgi:hypothetical protein
MDADHEVMTENLGERFVYLGRVGLVAERIAKLPLDLAERGLNVGPLVIMREELVPPVRWDRPKRPESP